MDADHRDGAFFLRKVGEARLCQMAGAFGPVTDRTIAVPLPPPNELPEEHAPAGEGLVSRRVNVREQKCAAGA